MGVLPLETRGGQLACVQNTGAWVSISNLAAASLTAIEGQYDIKCSPRHSYHTFSAACYQCLLYYSWLRSQHRIVASRCPWTARPPVPLTCLSTHNCVRGFDWQKRWRRHQSKISPSTRRWCPAASQMLPITPLQHLSSRPLSRARSSRSSHKT